MLRRGARRCGSPRPSSRLSLRDQVGAVSSAAASTSRRALLALALISSSAACAGALLALFGLAADPLRLGLQLLLGARPGFLVGLAFDLLDQLADPLLGLAADVLGALHDALLDLGLEPDGDLRGPPRRAPRPRRRAARPRRRGGRPRPAPLRAPRRSALGSLCFDLLDRVRGGPARPAALLRGHLGGERLAIGLGPLLRLLEGFLGAIAPLLGARRPRLGRAGASRARRRSARGLPRRASPASSFARCLESRDAARLLGLGDTRLATPHPLEGLAATP